MRLQHFKKQAFAITFAIALSGGISTAVEEGTWTTDFAAAKATAAKDGKDLLLDFTGSDWCGWCVKLKSEVFEQDAFKQAAPKNFVLVELDFPKQKKLPEKEAAQNEELQTKYAIQSFPSIVLLDSVGRRYARTGYQKGGPEVYLKHLEELRAQRVHRDEVLAKAEKASGVEKAKLLDQALTPLHENGMLGDYGDLVKQVAEMDADNKAGLKKKWESEQRLDELMQTPGDTPHDEILAKVDAYIKNWKPSGEEKQKVFVMRGQVCDAKGDQVGMLTAFKTAAEAAPDSELGRRLSEHLKQLEAGGEK